MKLPKIYLRLVTSDRDYWAGRHKPWYLGTAYRDWCTRTTVYYPLGVNLIVRFMRDIYFRVRCLQPSYKEKICQIIHDVGYEHGYKEGEADSFAKYERDRRMCLTLEDYILKESMKGENHVVQKETNPRAVGDVEETAT